MDDSDFTQTVGVDEIAHSNHSHLYRDSVLKRLARIEGYVRACLRMVDEDIDCPDDLGKLPLYGLS